MTHLVALERSSAAIAALALVLAPLPSGAQQPASLGPVALPAGPQVFRTSAATIRVTALKGLVYPWALAFLPNGDILVTEQSRNTLRIVRNGVLDPTPITGLPPGITSVRRDTAGVDVALHPRFAENRLVYVAYWKLKPGTEDVKTAALVRGRFDGGSTLTDVREMLIDGPSRYERRIPCVDMTMTTACSAG
jgi:glucose/arabinose dehydrogenase